MILGNQAGEPVVGGSGSGQVKQNWHYTPLEAICKEFGVSECQLKETSGVWSACNSDETCISYIGKSSNNGKDNDADKDPKSWELETH